MLSTNKIKDLLLHGENRQVEFKKCTDKVSASVYETVCSFLNAEGGYIFLSLDHITHTFHNIICNVRNEHNTNSKQK